METANADKVKEKKERKKYNDGKNRNEEGYEVDEDGFHEAGAKKPKEKSYHNNKKHNNYENKPKKEYHNKKNFKEQKEDQPKENTEKTEKPNEEVVEKPKEVVAKPVEAIKSDKVEIKITAQAKKLKDLFK